MWTESWAKTLFVARNPKWRSVYFHLPKCCFKHLTNLFSDPILLPSHIEMASNEGATMQAGIFEDLQHKIDEDTAIKDVGKFWLLGLTNTHDSSRPSVTLCRPSRSKARLTTGDPWRVFAHICRSEYPIDTLKITFYSVR